MADNPYSMEIDPQEKLKYRKEALKSFGNMQPALDSSQQLQRRQFSQQSTEGLVGARSEDIAAGLGKAAAGAAQMLPQQQAEQNALAMQGAGMEQDVIGSQQTSALKNFSRKQQLDQDAASKAVADRAFSLGMEAKQLVFHDKAKVADLAMNQMASDYEAGRATKQDLIKIQNTFRMQAIKKKTEADIEMTKAMADVKVLMAQGNVARAKTRIETALAKQREAAEDAGKAANISAIISGAFTIGGAVVGGIYGGPAGAAVGASAGKVVGSGVASATS